MRHFSPGRPQVRQLTLFPGRRGAVPGTQKCTPLKKGTVPEGAPRFDSVDFWGPKNQNSFFENAPFLQPVRRGARLHFVLGTGGFAYQPCPRSARIGA